MANGVLTLKGSGGNSYIGQSAILTVGVTYKIVFDATVRAGEGKIEKTGGGLMYSITSSGSHTVYWTADYTDLKFNRVDTACDMDIDNVYCYPVNDKNHGTTAFYGDELVTNGDCEVTDPTTITIGSEAVSVVDGTFDDSTEQEYAGSKSIKVTGDASSQYPSMVWSDGSDMGLVAGRTYSFECYYYLAASQNIDTVQIRALQNDGVTAVTDNDTATGTWTKLGPITFTDDDIDRLNIYAYEDGASAQDLTGDSFYVDAISLKEVGTATGWTDADQQLTIPQTALQSYNQLMWFDGAPSYDYVQLTDKYNHNVISISAWIFMNEVNASSKTIFSNGDSLTDGILFYLNADEKLTFKFHGQGDSTGATATGANALSAGKWYHVVGTYDDANLKLYINGQADTVVAYTDADLSVADNNARIGLFADSAAYPWNGSITEVSIWSAALTQAEIVELYNNGKALDATTHSNAVATSTNLKGYFRNNGLSTWTDLSKDYSNNGTPTNSTETMLITAGVDASKDSQGFIMNRQRTTSSLNLPANDGAEDVRIDTASGASPGDNINFVSNAFSFSCWVKLRYATGSAQIVFDRGDGTDGFLLKASATGIPVFVTEKDNTETSSTASGNNGGLSSGVMSFDTWYFICGTHEGLASSADQYLYVGCPSATDSSLYCVALQANGIIMDTSAADLRIGRRYSNTLPFNGTIDDLIFYDKELTAFESDGSVAESGDKITSGEVLRNYNAGKRSHR